MYVVCHNSQIKTDPSNSDTISIPVVLKFFYVFDRTVCMCAVLYERYDRVDMYIYREKDQIQHGRQLKQLWIRDPLNRNNCRFLSFMLWWEKIEWKNSQSTGQWAHLHALALSYNSECSTCWIFESLSHSLCIQYMNFSCSNLFTFFLLLCVSCPFGMSFKR